MWQILETIIWGLVAWVCLGIVLRRLRIWRRKHMLEGLNRDHGTNLTERDVYGDELEP